MNLSSGLIVSVSQGLISSSTFDLYLFHQKKGEAQTLYYTAVLPLDDHLRRDDQESNLGKRFPL